MEKVKTSTAASHHLFWQDGSSTAVADSARSLARCLGPNSRQTRDECTRARVRHGGPEFEASDRRHRRTGGTLYFGRSHLSISPSNILGDRRNKWETSTVPISRRTSEYVPPLLARVFNVQPKSAHSANHNSSASP